jgi:hypothetical protein
MYNVRFDACAVRCVLLLFMRMLAAALYLAPFLFLLFGWRLVMLFSCVHIIPRLSHSKCMEATSKVSIKIVFNGESFIDMSITLCSKSAKL